MSRAYRIRLAESERRYIVVEDRVCTDIELLPILPAERLSELLAAELARRGFAIEDGVARRRDGDIEIAVELDTGRVSAGLEQATEVARSAARTVVRPNVTTLSQEEEAEVRSELRRELDAGMAADTARLQEGLTARLQAALADLQREMDDVSHRVAGSALKEKAAQLGEILELSEDESGSMTIKVRV